jgi:hypothetical protein
MTLLPCFKSDEANDDQEQEQASSDWFYYMEAKDIGKYFVFWGSNKMITSLSVETIAELEKLMDDADESIPDNISYGDFVLENVNVVGNNSIMLYFRRTANVGAGKRWRVACDVIRSGDSKNDHDLENITVEVVEIEPDEESVEKYSREKWQNSLGVVRKTWEDMTDEEKAELLRGCYHLYMDDERDFDWDSDKENKGSWSWNHYAKKVKDEVLRRAMQDIGDKWDQSIWLRYQQKFSSDPDFWVWVPNIVHGYEEYEKHVEAMRLEEQEWIDAMQVEATVDEEYDDDVWDFVVKNLDLADFGLDMSFWDFIGTDYSKSLAELYSENGISQETRSATLKDSYTDMKTQIDEYLDELYTGLQENHPATSSHVFHSYEWLQELDAWDRHGRALIDDLIITWFDAPIADL